METTETKEKIKVESAKIKWVPDFDPDLSWLNEEYEIDYPANFETLEDEERDDKESEFDDMTDEEKIEAGGQLRIIKSCQHDQEEVKKYGSKEIFGYIQKNLDRIESYNNNQWIMLGCVCEIEISYLVKEAGNRRISETFTNSLWGIESDTDPAYLEEVANDQFEITKDEIKGHGIKVRFPKFDDVEIVED